MPFDFSPVQLLIVLAIVLLVFGAKRLPEIARNLGSSAREFKEGIQGHEKDAPDPPRVDTKAELPPGEPIAEDPAVTVPEDAPKGEPRT